MRKIYPFISLFILLSFAAQSQKPPIQLNWLNTAPGYLNGGSFSAQGVTNLSDGSVVVVGYFQHTVDFDPGPDTFNLTTTAYYGIFIAKYTNNGKLAFAYAFSESNPYFFDENYESANAVTADADDNIYVTGIFRGQVDFDPDAGKTILSTGNSPQNNFIACYTKNGKLKYAKDITSGGVGYSTTALSLVLDKNKNIYVTGNFDGTSVDFNPGMDSTSFTSLEEDIFFAKYDSAGNYVFAKTIGGNSYDEVSKIALDSKNNILLCGSFYSANVDFDPGTTKHILKRLSDKADMFFAKYDTLGNYIFAKNVGNYKYNSANSIAVGKDDAFVLTGSFYGTSVDFDVSNAGVHLLNSNGNSDAFVAKYNNNGNCVFAFDIGNASGLDNGVDIGLDSNNNIICIGAFGGKSVDFNPDTSVYKISSSQAGYYYIAKYSYSGKFLSAIAIGDLLNSYNFRVNCLHVTQSGKILTGGYYQDKFDADSGADSLILTSPAPTMFVTKYDDNENYLGVITGNNYFDYGFASSQISSSATDKKGNVYVCGQFTGRFDFDDGPNKYILASSINMYNQTEENGYFAKYDKNGKLLFAKAISGGDNFVNDVAVDNNGNIYLTGTADGVTDFDPADNVYYLNNDTAKPYNYYNYFFAKYDKDGKLIFAKGNGNGNSYGLKISTIALDDKNNICIAGRFNYSIDFDPGVNTHILTGGIGSGNMFISKYDSTGNYIFTFSVQSSNSAGVVNDLKVDNANNIIITGTFTGQNLDFNPGPKSFLLSSGSYYNAGFIAKYKNNGVFISAIALDRLDYYSNFSCLSTDKQGNIYISGSSTNKTDFDPGAGIAVLSGKYEPFFASYSSNLEFKFLKGLVTYGDSYTERNIVNQICLDKSNNIYIAGSFSSANIDCDPGQDTALLVNKRYYYGNGSELLIGKYDSLGNYIYGFQFTGDSVIGYNNSAAIIVDSEGTINYAGTFQTKINFGLGLKKQYAVPTERYNLFIAQYKPTLAQSNTSNIISATKPAIINTIKVYPNPIKDHINIQLNNITQNNAVTTINLFDMNGKCLQTNQTTFTNHYLNTNIKLPQNLSAGNYFITVDVAGKTYYSNALIK